MPASTATTPTTLSPVERGILERLDGQVWKAEQLTDEAVAAAWNRWNAMRAAVGFTTRNTGWVTTSKTNSKMGKSGLPTIGVTMHAARRANEVWSALPLSTRCALAEALEVPVADVDLAVARTVCPRSTAGCRAVCVTAFSANSKFDTADLTRLNRTLLSLVRPADAFALTGHHLEKLQARHGDECRWRVNVSDDVRWELVAPGLFDLGVAGYAYTKWAPSDRPGFVGLSVVYSATERMTDAEIISMVSLGHRVATVLDVPRKKLPAIWRGVEVVDGDKTDDLFEHKTGVVVGLAAKGTSKEVIDSMRASGFARPA
jgi:hypothetical protein